MSGNNKGGQVIMGLGIAIGFCCLAALPTCLPPLQATENVDTPLSNAESAPAPAKPSPNVQKLLP